MLKILGIVMTGLVATSVWAADIKLPAPDKTNQTTLIKALEDRHSDREFSAKPIDEKAD